MARWRSCGAEASEYARGGSFRPFTSSRYAMKRSSASNWCGSMVRKCPAWYSRRSLPVNSTRVVVSGVSTKASATMTSSSLMRRRGPSARTGSPSAETEVITVRVGSTAEGCAITPR